MPDWPGEAARLPTGSAGWVTLDTSVDIDYLVIEPGGALLDLASVTLRADDVTNSGILAVGAHGGSDAFLAGRIENTAYGSLQIHSPSSLTVTSCPTLQNDGEIALNGSASALPATLTFRDDTTLTGTGNLWLRFPSAGLDVVSWCVLTHGAGHTIHGRGSIEGNLANAGLIHADVADGELVLSRGTVTNTGTLKSSGGAVLCIGSDVVQSGDGQIVADGATVRLYAGASVGGPVTLLHGAELALYGNSHAELPGGTFAHDGTITLNVNGMAGAETYLRFGDDATLSGPGEVVMNAGSPTTSLQAGPDRTLTNGAEHAIRGQGEVTGLLRNEGTILADLSGATLFLEPAEAGLTNLGTLAATAGGGMTIRQAQRFANEGTVSVAAGSLLAAEGGYVQSAGATVVDGEITVSGAAMDLGGGALRGRGTVTADVVVGSGAGVSPGPDIAALTVAGAYSQSDGAVLEVELTGPGGSGEEGHGCDVLRVGGDMDLAGTLSLSWLPLPGDPNSKFGGEYDVVACDGALAGTPAVGGEIAAYVDQVSHVTGPGETQIVRLRLHGLLEGDADLNGSVGREDLAALRDGLGSLDSGWGRGDFDLDGDADAFDYVTLKRNWARSVPVPEPLTLWLLALAGLGLGRRRRPRN